MEVLQIPLEQLKHEFRDILFSTKYATAVAHAFKKLNSSSISTSKGDSTSIRMHYEDYTTLHRVLSTEDIESLQRIAEMLKSTDCFQDCVQIYVRRRKDTVNMICGQLLKKMNVEAVRVFAYWEELSEKIQRWIQIARICTVNIFVREKCLYEQIFGSLATVEGAEGYVHIIGDATGKLFEFPDSLITSRRSPQKLEILLPLYREILNLMPAVDGLFPKDLCSTKNIRDRAPGIVCRLAQHISRLLSASERHILRELSINPTPGGAIHPLTEYVISYIDLIFNHKKSLSDLIGTLEGSNDVTTPELDSLEIDQGQTIPLKHHLTRIIGFLQYNLRYKSKFYDHKPLSHLFMMNNVHCVAQKIGSSLGLQEIIGYNYQMKLRNRVEQAMTDYLKTTWNGVLCCLRDDERSKPQGKWNFLSGKSNRAVKEKFKAFNLMIENIHQIQTEWEVPDKQLRRKLQKSILDRLIPAYRHFLDRSSGQIDKFPHPEKYIKYSVKELESKVLNMFLFEDMAQTTADAPMSNLKQVFIQVQHEQQRQRTAALATDTIIWWYK